MSESMGMIFDIRKGSQQDGPGSRTAVLFKGCSMNCWWCPNPEMHEYSPELVLREERCVRCGTCVKICSMEAAQVQEISDGSVRYTVDRDICIVCGSCIGSCQGEARELVGKRMTVTEVMQPVESDLALYKQSAGGVTFSGGEPFMQAAFLGELLKACKQLGIHTAVDTSGYTPWEVIDRVRADIDLFLFDLKMMDEERHREFTGLSNTVILQNLKALSTHGHPIVLRVPLIPQVNDDPANLQAIAEFAASLPHLEYVDLIPFQQTAVEKFERLGKPYRSAGADVPQPHSADLTHYFTQFGLSTHIADFSYQG